MWATIRDWGFCEWNHEAETISKLQRGQCSCCLLRRILGPGAGNAWVTGVISDKVVLLNSLACPLNKIIHWLHWADRKWVDQATQTFGTYIISRHCHHTPAFLHYRGEKYPLLECLLFGTVLLTIFKTYRGKKKRHTHTHKSSVPLVEYRYVAYLCSLN